MTEEKGSKMGQEGGSGCEAESEPHGTAPLLRNIFPAVVKSCPDMSAAEIFTVQCCSTINNTG